PKPRRVTADRVVGAAVSKGNIHGLLVGDHLGVAADFLKQLAQVDRLQVEPRCAGSLTGNEQKIVDQHREALRLLDDALDRLLIGTHLLVRSTQCDLALAADDRERGAQLMADVSEKTAASLVDLT